HHPPVFGIGLARFPAGQVLAVEQFDRLPPGECVVPGQRRGPTCLPLCAVAIVVGRFAAEYVPFQPPLEDHVLSSPFPLRRHDEAKASLVKLHARNGTRAAKPPDVGTDERPASRQPHLKPRRVLPLVATYDDVPAADDRRLIWLAA